MKISRLRYIVMFSGMVAIAAIGGCKRDQIERHRVAKLPQSPQGDAAVTQDQSTNVGKLPAGHPDVSGMTPQQMQQMAGQMPGMNAGAQAGGEDVTYTLPTGWTEKTPPGPMLLHEIEAGEARMTVSMLGSNGGGLLANVNRWRGPQLGLPPVDEQGLMKLVKPTKVDGVEGWRVEMSGEAKDAKEIIGVIVEHGGGTWFFKLMGERAATASQAEAFDQFMQSVTWK